MSLQLCHPYVWEDPRYMFKAWFIDAKCISELVNRVIVTYLVFIIVGFLLSSLTHISMIPAVAGLLATAILIPTFIQLSKVDKSVSSNTEVRREVKKEGFMNETGTPGNLATLPKKSDVSQYKPLARNPFDNVLMDEYTESPQRQAAADITTTESKVALDAMFRTQWYSDPTDVFGKTQGQRIFITNPSTTIPNDQGSYQNWLYKIPGKTCKEGNPEACYGGTEGAVMPWLNL